MRTVTLHPELLSSAKAQSLEGDQFKFWINLLLICAGRDGCVPEIPAVAFALRQREGETARMLGVLLDAGLLEDVGAEGLVVHDWHDWATKRIAGPTSTDRVRAYRERVKSGVDADRRPGRPSRRAETFHETLRNVSGGIGQSVQKANGKGEEGGDYRGGDRGMGSSDTSVSFPNEDPPKVPANLHIGGAQPIEDGFELTPPPADDGEAKAIAAALQAKATRSISNEFTIFWAAWPEKQNRKRAFAAWAGARKRASLEAILAGLRRYVAGKPADRAWMHASTFLNGDRWEDGLDKHLPTTVGPVVVDEGGNRIRNWPGEKFGGLTPEAVFRLWAGCSWLPPWGPAPPMPGAPRGESGCALPQEWLDKFWAWHREKQGKAS